MSFMSVLAAGLLAVALSSAITSAGDVQQGGALVTDSSEQQATGPPAVGVFSYQLTAPDQQVGAILITGEASAVGASTDEGIVMVTMTQTIGNTVIANTTVIGTGAVSNTVPNTDNESRNAVAGFLVAAFLTVAFVIGIANVASSQWFLNQKARVELFARSLVVGTIHGFDNANDTVTSFIPTALTAADTNMKSVGKTGPILAFAS